MACNPGFLHPLNLGWMSVLLCLIQPWQGSAEQAFKGSSGHAWQANRSLRKWGLHARGREWVVSNHGKASGVDRYVSGQGCIHALAVCDSFKVFNDHGQLEHPDQRLLRDFMFLQRGKCLQELMFSSVKELFIFDDPMPIDDLALVRRGGREFSGQRTDIVHINAHWLQSAKGSLTDSTGHKVQCSDLLQQLRAREGIEMFVVTRNDQNADRACLDFGRCFGLQIPLVLLDLVLQRKWLDLAVGDVSLTKRGVSAALRKHFLVDAGLAAQPSVPHIPHISFDPNLFMAAANLVRGGPEAADAALSRNNVLKWLDDMADNSALGLSHLKNVAQSGAADAKGASSYKMERLIRCIMLCGYLRSDMALYPVVQDVGVMFGMQDGWLSQAGVSLPSKSTLQRHRFTVDAALCLCTRNKFQATFLFVMHTCMSV